MTRLNFDVHPGDGPPMLMIHGLLCSRALWNLNLEALSEFCTPVSVELYGHGRSPAPKSPCYYEPDYYLTALETIRHQLDAEKIYLCGQSLGASLTIRFEKYPVSLLFLPGQRYEINRDHRRG